MKPLSHVLKCVGCFAGATIMGDGQVALIMDVPGLANHIGITRNSQKASRPAVPPPEHGTHRRDALHSSV